MRKFDRYQLKKYVGLEVQDFTTALQETLDISVELSKPWVPKNPTDRQQIPTEEIYLGICMYMS